VLHFRFESAFYTNPDTKFVIVHDQDSHDCKKLKSELLGICQSAGKSKVMIRIICHELESWFLGDLIAVEKAYGLNPKSLSRKQNQIKFRDPDRLNSAKEELRKLVSEYYPGTHSRAIAPYLSLTNNKSRSFLTFIDGINKLLS
jgi:predicted PP-loop superfamily ATPase